MSRVKFVKNRRATDRAGSWANVANMIKTRLSDGNECPPVDSGIALDENQSNEDVKTVTSGPRQRLGGISKSPSSGGSMCTVHPVQSPECEPVEQRLARRPLQMMHLAPAPEPRPPGTMPLRMWPVSSNATGQTSGKNTSGATSANTAGVTSATPTGGQSSYTAGIVRSATTALTGPSGTSSKRSFLPSPTTKKGRRLFVIVVIITFLVHALRLSFVVLDDVTDTKGFYFSDAGVGDSVAAFSFGDMVFEGSAILATIFIYMGIIMEARITFLRVGLILGWFVVMSLFGVHGAAANVAQTNAIRTQTVIAKSNGTAAHLQEFEHWLKARTALAIINMLYDLFAWAYILFNGGSIVFVRNAERRARRARRAH
jgi:hypothetical protein